MIRWLCFICMFGALAGPAQAQAFGWTGSNSLAMPQPGESELRLLTPTLLELTHINTKKDETSPVSDWDFVGPNFTPRLPAPGAFKVRVNNSEIPVRRVGFKRRPLYAPLKERDLRILNQLYLELERAAPGGAKIELQWQGRTYKAPSDATRFSPALHVNQVGYYPDDSKRAMAGYYLGTLGELKIPADRFTLIDAAGKTVFEGKLRVRRDRGWSTTPAPYQSVLEANFTEFKKPGVYRLAVEGMGASYPFRIGEGIPAAFARTYALGLYHQRCGTSNALPFTRHTHAACHTAPAEIPTRAHKNAQQVIAEVSADAKQDPRHTAPQLKNTDASLYPFVREGKIDVSGGHHDAGDYSKYTINSASLVHALVFAADNFPGAGELDNLGLPESGDGKSDLLQEAKWEADFLAKMQDNDGGFFFLVYPKDRRYEDNVLPDQGDPQIVWPKNTSATAAATAALAEIGSSPLFKKQFPEAADQYLIKARRGWAFLERAIAGHGSDGAYQKLTHYGNEFLHDDELGWAAAALFAATGDKQFEKKFASLFNPDDPKTRRWSWWPLFEGWGNAVRAYVFAVPSGRRKQGEATVNFAARCENLIHETARNHVRFASETAYGTSFPDPNKANQNAGWYFSMERAFDLAAAYQLRREPGYLDAIISNLNYEAGCNPVNVSYITGLGERRQRELVHQYAQNDRRVLPPSGLPIGNIQAGFAYLHHYKKDLGALTFPPDGAKTAPYPFYDRWGDSFNTTTEFVVVDQGRSLATAAFLMARTKVKDQPWRPSPAKITGIPATVPAGGAVTARMEIPNAEEAQIVWEARDQEPVMAGEFLFSPRNVGEQWVEAEALWPDGRRAFAQASFTATAPLNAPANPFRSANLKPGPEYVALYHLDNDLRDAAGRSAPLQLHGQAAMDSSNLSWMSQRTGAALRFRDLGDNATVAIDLSKIPGEKREITVEAMIYINSFKAYNRDNARILSLAEDWNSTIELIENKYEGPMIKGGTEFSMNKSQVARALSLTNWHHLALTIDHAGYTVRVNGKEVEARKSAELAHWGRKPARLELGNFDGYIDEVAVICKMAP